MGWGVGGSLQSRPFLQACQLLHPLPWPPLLCVRACVNGDSSSDPTTLPSLTPSLSWPRQVKAEYDRVCAGCVNADSSSKSFVRQVCLWGEGGVEVGFGWGVRGSLRPLVACLGTSQLLGTEATDDDQVDQEFCYHGRILEVQGLNQEQGPSVFGHGLKIPGAPENYRWLRCLGADAPGPPHSPPTHLRTRSPACPHPCIQLHTEARLPPTWDTYTFVPSQTGILTDWDSPSSSTPESSTLSRPSRQDYADECEGGVNTMIK